MRRALAYRRKGGYVVCALAATTDGVWIVWEPMLAVSGEAELGQAILAALAGSRQDVAHPTDWKSALRPLLAVGGVTSWATFARAATCIEVEEQDGNITLVPTRNLGVAGGFEEDQARKVFTAREDPRLGWLASEVLRPAAERS